MLNKYENMVSVIVNSQYYQSACVKRTNVTVPIQSHHARHRNEWFSNSDSKFNTLYRLNKSDTRICPARITTSNQSLTLTLSDMIKSLNALTDACYSFTQCVNGKFRGNFRLSHKYTTDVFNSSLTCLQVVQYNRTSQTSAIALSKIRN